MTLEAGSIRPPVRAVGARSCSARRTAYFLNASNSGGPLWPSGGGTLGGSAVYVSGSSSLRAQHLDARRADIRRLHIAPVCQRHARRERPGEPAQSKRTRIHCVSAATCRTGNSSRAGSTRVRVYSRALSQGEIQTDMNTSIGVIAPDTTPPSAPRGFVATASSSTQIALSWTAATDNVGVTGYQLERCQGSGCSNFLQIATPATTSYGDTGLAASTSYSYRVRALDAAGNLGGHIRSRAPQARRRSVTRHRRVRQPGSLHSVAEAHRSI